MRIPRPSTMAPVALRSSPTRRTNSKPVFVRFATKSSTGAGERRALHSLPLSDLECSRRGFNLLSPALDVSVLEPFEQRELFRLCRRFNSQFKGDQGRKDVARRSELLGRLPRCSVVGLDIDADKEQGRAAFVASRAIAELLVDAFSDLGYQLAAFHSSGPEKPGVHLHFGECEPDARIVNLDRVFMRLVKKVALKAGLVEHSASKTKRGALTLVRPIDVENPEPAAKLDLIPFNHAPTSKGRLFRPVGGLNKDKSARKVATAWSRFAVPSKIDRRLLAMSPKPEITKGRSRVQKNYKHKPIKRSKPRREANRYKKHILRPLVAALQDLASPGLNHELRKAIAGLAISKSLLDRNDWIYAFDAGLPDSSDADEAVKVWDSTAQRVALSLPFTAGGKIRDLIGSTGVSKLALAISKATGESFVDVLTRFGRPSLKWEKNGSTRLVAAFMDRRDAASKADDEKQVTRIDKILKSLKRTINCGDIMLTPTCQFCSNCIHDASKMFCETVLCASCVFKKLKSYESWLGQQWKGDDERHDDFNVRYTPTFVRFDGFETRKKAFKALNKIVKKTDTKARRSVHANPDGTWSIVIFSLYFDVTRNDEIAWRNPDGTEESYKAVESHSLKKKSELIALVLDTLARNFAAIMTMIKNKNFKLAAKTIDEVRGTHAVYGKDRTPWPTSKHLKTFRKEVAIELNKTEDRSHLCDGSCPEESGVSYEYTHTPTGWSTNSETRYPMSFSGVIERREFELSFNAPKLE